MKFNTEQLLESLEALNAKYFCEAGEPDQDYDQEAYEAIAKHLKMKGFEAKHKEFDKYQGVYVDVLKAGKKLARLWTIDSFVTGKTKESDAKFSKAELIDDDGEKVSWNRGDYFMAKPDKVFDGYVLKLWDKSGKMTEIESPKVSDLPNSRDVKTTVEFVGKPNEVLVLQPEDSEDSFAVELKDGSVVSDSGLVDALKAKKQKHVESLDSVLSDFKSGKISDDDALQVKILEHFGFIYKTNIEFLGGILGAEGKKGSDVGVAIISGGDYENPEMISLEQFKEIWQTYGKDQKVTLFTNSGVEIHSQDKKNYPNIKIVKVPSGLADTMKGDK